MVKRLIFLSVFAFLAGVACRDVAEWPTAEGFDLDGDQPGRHQPTFDRNHRNDGDDDGGDDDAGDDDDGQRDENLPPPSADGDTDDGDDGAGPADGGAVDDLALLDGPAAALTIDRSVYEGDFGFGVWLGTFEFRMADYPVTWAIAVAHASMLMRSRGIDLSPNAVLSFAIKESRLGCTAVPFRDGCFQIESTTAYAELRNLDPTRFAASHAEVIADDHFESAALSGVYYHLLTEGMLHNYSRDVAGFFENHPTGPEAHLKVLSSAYNRGWWWDRLSVIFSNCTQQDVIACYGGAANDVAIDHSEAIAAYTSALNASTPFDASLRLQDLLDYWESIRLAYQDVDNGTVRETLRSSFATAGDGAETISFHTQLKGVLQDLIDLLPPVPTRDQVFGALCRRDYLNNNLCP